MNKRVEKRDYQLSGHAPDEAGVNLDCFLPFGVFLFSFGHVYVVYRSLFKYVEYLCTWQKISLGISQHIVSSYSSIYDAFIINSSLHFSIVGKSGNPIRATTTYLVNMVREKVI